MIGKNWLKPKCRSIVGIVYVTSAYGLAAVDERNGNVLWAGPGGDHSSPAVSPDGVFVSFTCDAYKLDPIGGTVLWHFAEACSGGGGKTAAYANKMADTIKAGDPVYLTGRVICGRSGLKRVEYWVRPLGEKGEDANPLADDAPELLRGPWLPCELQPEPDWSETLPKGISSREVLSFDKTTGHPSSWPLRYSMVSWSTSLAGLARGKYAVRVRAVDLNGFAQPEPRPNQKTGMNALEVREFEVM